MTRKRKRELNFQEQILWEAVTRSIKPLVTRKPLPDTAESLSVAKNISLKVGQQSKAPELPISKSRRLPEGAPVHLTPVLPPMVTMIRRERRALVRGVAAIDASLDLHGMRQDEAQRHLRAFLVRSSAAGFRTVLIVTGKGALIGNDALWRPGEQSRGVLRRLAPLLLESGELRDIVLGYEPADKRHGGAGALYVRLRRRST